MNWKSTEPNNGDIDGLCVAKYEFDGWIDADCTSLWDWRNAQDYCRQYYTDLATIHNEEEHQNISHLLGHVQYAWIGLFFDNWKWSDRRSTSFRYWMAGQPYSPKGNANCTVAKLVFPLFWRFKCYANIAKGVVVLVEDTN
uniref:C-type lectin domain-containing protein n=1 Tax=Pygocentrus nattereri TaxID=42514 RepID=A0AAR2K8G8_PYGNA